MKTVAAHQVVNCLVEQTDAPHKGVLVTVTVSSPQGVRRDLEPFWIDLKDVADFAGRIRDGAASFGYQRIPGSEIESASVYKVTEIDVSQGTEPPGVVLTLELENSKGERTRTHGFWLNADGAMALMKGIRKSLDTLHALLRAKPSGRRPS